VDVQEQFFAALADFPPSQIREIMARLAESRVEESRESIRIPPGYQVEQRRQPVPSQPTLPTEQQLGQLPYAKTYQMEVEQQAEHPLGDQRPVVNVGNDDVVESISQQGYRLQGLQSLDQSARGSETTAAERVQQWLGGHGRTLEAALAAEASGVVYRRCRLCAPDRDWGWFPAESATDSRTCST
jgi:hypothetical protein